MSTPLSSVNPASMEELLDRDPLSLTEDEVSETAKLLVIHFREQRKVWEEEKRKAKVTGKRVSGQTVKKKQKQAALDKIKSGSVGLDLSTLIKK